MAKIAMIALSYYPDDPRIRREAETLARAGDEVEIFCLRDAREAKIERLNGITAHRIVRGVNKESLINYLWLSAKLLFAAFFSLNRFFLKRRFQLLHVHNMPDYLVFAGIVQKALGVPIILDLHDLMVELFESKWGGVKTKIVLPIVKAVEMISCGFADHLITTSVGFEEKLIVRGIRPQKITLILNSADENIFKNQYVRKFVRIEHGAKLLYHGTVAERFGLVTAINAVARLQKIIPDSTLHIFGKYDTAYRHVLEEQIDELGLAARVVLGKYLSLEEIREIICQSDIGIVPYNDDAFMKLALSTKAFEYVVMGLPVVASRLASLQAIFDENCIKYFAPGRADDLAVKIAEFCLDPQIRQGHAMRAAAEYKDVSWQIMENRFINLVGSQVSGARCNAPPISQIPRVH